MIRWTTEMESVIKALYPTEEAQYISKLLNNKFGVEVSKIAIRKKAFDIGVKHEYRFIPDRAVQKVRWSSEPEKDAWMDEHDTGQSLSALSKEFEQAFGFPLSRGQINIWRANNHRQPHNSHGGGNARLPIGTERATGKGYTLVKVREEPTTPMSKDNWEMKHKLIWESIHGKLPDDMDIFFADGDHDNLDPENLVAVPKRLRARLNSNDSPDWYDAESLKAALNIALLKEKIVDTKMIIPRKCGVCGREFTPSGGRWETKLQTCDDCRAKGLKSRGKRTVKAIRKCIICGQEYGATRYDQIRCPECIKKKIQPPRRQAK